MILCALVTTFIVFRQTFAVGFLLDDFYHVHYLHRVLGGDWRGFLTRLHDDWSGDSDGMTSYRPLLSIALLLIFALGKETALGFHIANIVLLSACGICVFYLSNLLIGSISGQCSKLTSLGAMLLFLTCPLHIESSVTATNGGDLLSGLFYLLSLIAYCIYKKNNQTKWTIAVSLLSFFCALLTKEIAVTLPAVVSIASLFYPKTTGLERVNKKRPGITMIGKVEALYWLALLIYGVLRTSILGVIVGGYGSTGLRMIPIQFSAFFNPTTIHKIFFPLNEHMQFPDLAINGLLILYIIIGLRGIFLLLNTKTYQRVTIFFLLWIIVGILPTFQIWHIYPNLIGSRLFFISSIPFCMLLALLGSGDISTAKSDKNKIVSALFKSTPILLSLVWAACYLSTLQLMKQQACNWRKLSPI